MCSASHRPQVICRIRRSNSSTEMEGRKNKIEKDNVFVVRRKLLVGTVLQSLPRDAEEEGGDELEETAGNYTSQ